MLKRFPDKINVVCSVCQRHALALGAAAGKGRNPPTAWVCEEASCLSLLGKVAAMPARELNSYEAFALSDAGDDAGEYLQRLGKTDLGDLSREEWLRFLAIVLTSYGDHMRARLAS